MKLSTLILICALLVTGVTGAKFTGGLTIQGDCAAMVNSDSTWESGTDVDTVSQDGDYLGGAAGHVFVSGPGATTYQKFDTLDATIAHRYNATGYYSVYGGGIYGDTLAMDSYMPGIEPILCDAGNIVQQDGSVPGQNPVHEWVDGGVIGIAGKMTATTAKFVNDANYTLSQQTGVDGAGLVTGNLRGSVEAGGNYTNSKLNYRNQVSNHFTAGSNLTGGFVARSDWNWDTFKDVFVTQSAENLTVLRNNTTVNQT